MQEALNGRAQVLPLGSYEVCWFFQYADGREKKGIFNNPGKGNDTAFSQSKEGLVKAGVIARCGNRKETRVLMCEGQDFCNFLWDAGKYVVSGQTVLAGLSLVTRDTKATFFLDGSAMVEARNNNEDKFFHYGR